MQRARKVGAARERLLCAALELFARHGVSGTSLQMIADELGVTKAAVYFQFRSKEDIVLAVISPAMEELGRAADAAEAKGSRTARREAALTGLVDVVVRNRALARILRADPSVDEVLRGHPVMQAHADRIVGLLTGPDPDDETRVTVAMVGGGLMVVGSDPQMADMDDETLRHHLLGITRRMLRLRSTAKPGTVHVT